MCFAFACLWEQYCGIRKNTDADCNYLVILIFGERDTKFVYNQCDLQIGVHNILTLGV